MFVVFLYKNFKNRKGDLKMKSKIKNFMGTAKRNIIKIANNKKGNGIIEFFVITAVIAVLLFATLGPMGTSIKKQNTTAINKIDSLVKLSEAE